MALLPLLGLLRRLWHRLPRALRLPVAVGVALAVRERRRGTSS